ncbi:MAG TPA: type 4a pilus biogenesis protein PilO [Candidatus Omnitrophota bacterium]|nr:type 4a pilus biogenesis protein PilO [Candidatus Omnitrophota bacterium]HSA30432.1 type 4a pilus biogenesis protein PilO [Candidatus Omnitrophota bacterium]
MLKQLDVKEKIMEFVVKLNEKNPYYVIIGVLVCLLLIDYFGLMQFQLGALRELNPKIQQIKTDFKLLEDGQKRMDQYQKESQRLDEKMGNMDLLIRTRAEIPSILENISRIGNKNRMRIEQIVPDTALDEPVMKNGEGAYYLMPIVLEAKGGYHEFGRFLNQLEREGIVANVSRLSMIGDEESGQRQHQISITMNTIIFEPALK